MGARTKKRKNSQQSNAGQTLRTHAHGIKAKACRIIDALEHEEAQNTAATSVVSDFKRLVQRRTYTRHLDFIEVVRIALESAELTLSVDPNYSDDRRLKRTLLIAEHALYGAERIVRGTSTMSKEIGVIKYEILGDQQHQKSDLRLVEEQIPVLYRHGSTKRLAVRAA